MSFRDELYAGYTLHPSHDDASGHGSFARVYGHHLRGWLPEDKSLPMLDLGCGDGRLLGFLAGRGFEKLVGVDRVEAQVERSRRSAPGAEVILGDATAVLRSSPGRFAAIFCIDVLEHLTRDESLALLQLARAALQPGGFLVAQVPNAASPFVGDIRYGDLTHEIAFTPASLSHLLLVAGFVEPAFRECGPVAKNLKGIMRVALWRLLRAGLRLWNVVEMGSAGAGVYTRVMLARAERRGD